MGDQRTLEQQVLALQEQLQQLTLALNQQRRDRSPPRFHVERNEYEDSDEEEVNPYGRRTPDRRQHNDIKVDIPEFEGKMDPDVFIEWLRTVERVFDYKQIPGDKKVKLVALKLRNYASTWWANVCSKREGQGKQKIRDWRKMKKLLKEKFLPAYHLQESFSKLHFLRQNNRPSEEYSQEFEHLLMKCGLNEDDPQTLVRYLGGLDPHIAQVVELQPYHTLAELTILAHRVEAQQRSKGKPDSNKFEYKNSSNLRYVPVSSSNSMPASTSENPKAPRRCFRCQGLGHIASECPNKRIVTLADFEITSGSEINDGGLPEPVKGETVVEELVGPDEGDCLVIRRALHSTPTREENSQREAIFHTRCTIGQRVCTVIIDGGSCTNAVSQVLIDKLGLKREPHPSPYAVHWLNHGKGMFVHHRVLITLSIGRSYVDEIWCDVLPMEACHVLLGRPWQFDRQATHDGYRNTYSFIHNGRKVVLTPMSHATQSTKPPGSLSALLRVGKNDCKAVRRLCLVSCDDDVLATHLLQPVVFDAFKSLVSPTSILVFPYSVQVRQANCHASSVIVADLYPYLDPGGPFPSLRTNFSKEGEDVSQSDPAGPNSDPVLNYEPSPNSDSTDQHTSSGNELWVSMIQACSSPVKD